MRLEVANGRENDIHNGPHAQAPKRQKLEHPVAYLPEVEAVGAKAAKEYAERKKKKKKARRRRRPAVRIPAKKATTTKPTLIKVWSTIACLMTSYTRPTF